MAEIKVDGANPNAVNIVPPAACKGEGYCAVIANTSPTDTLYLGENINLLQQAKANGTITGVPLGPGAILIEPWVTDGIWAINYVVGATPNDKIYTIVSSS